ncbi:MAG: cyclase family protein, partial [Mycobacteriales bacterium]
FQYADDYVFMPLQGGSQWDALGHVFYDGKLYNGFPADNVSVHGAKKCSIDKMCKGIAGRGVLLDVARTLGVDWMEQGQVISPDDLDRTAREHGVDVGEGDILLFRTGWRRKFLSDHDPVSFMAGEPGLGMACAEWLHERGVAAVCSDNWAIEVLPGEYPDEVLNVHMVLIRDMGMTLGEILDFEELAEDCASDGVYEFFFCAPALKFTNGVGSPINPLAIK